MRQDSSDKGKEVIQCHECRGFGHIASQCANTLMKKKAMVTSFSDSDTGETVPSQSELPAEDLSDSDDEELTQESLAQTYKDLYEKWLLLIKVNKKLNDTVASVWQEVEILLTQKVELECTVDSLNTQLDEMKQERTRLLAQNVDLMGIVSTLKLDMEKDRETHPVGMAGLRKTITDLKRKEVFQLRRVEQLELQLESERINHTDTKKELNHLKQSARMLNSGTEDLNDILRSQRMESGHRGLGFTEEGTSKGTILVKAQQVTDQLPEHKVEQSKGKNRADHKETHGTPSGIKTRRSPVQNCDYSLVKQRIDQRTCWYCHQMGHIKLKCRLFLAERRALQQRTTSRQKQVWVQKVDQTVCMVAYSSIYTAQDSWHLDSGCSAHMTGNSQYLTHIRPVEQMWLVTFGDGGKGQVIGCGTLMVPDLPALKNTLLVKGLTRNLISISQLCDDGHYVSFSSYSFLVIDKNGDTLMKGRRDVNNCYTIGMGLMGSMKDENHGKRPVALTCANAQHRFLRGGVDKTLHTRSDWGCAQIHVDNCLRKLLNHQVSQLRKEFVQCPQKYAWSRTRKYEYEGHQKMINLRHTKTFVNPYGRLWSGTPRSPVGLCGVNH
ncbi:unnamed protein product [Rhodiola kirilowii]